MKRSFEIDSDCLDIVERIRAIDKDYFIMFDLDVKRFQLHNKSQRISYCLTFPYDCLDERAVDMVLKTRTQNADEIFAQIEADNKKIQEKKVKDVLNEKIYDS